MSPREIDRLSLWEFLACVAGYNRSQGADAGPKPPTDEEFYAALEEYPDG